jgi:hypothetical protein
VLRWTYSFLGNSLKNDNGDEPCDFLWIRWIWPMKCLRILYCTHTWTVRIQGIGYWAGLLGFELIVRLILSYDLERRTWLKMTFVNQLIVNPLWRVIICYVRMISGVFMWQLHVVWFLDVVGNCIYDMWWGIVNDCIYTSIGDGEVIIVVWTYAL